MKSDKHMAGMDHSFDSVRQNLQSAGWLVGKAEPKVLLLAARSRGEGVTTVTTGLAFSCAAQYAFPVLVIYGSGRADTGRPAVPPDGQSVEDIVASIRLDAPGQPGRLHIGDARDMAARPDFYAALMQVLRARFPLILIDGGCVGDETLRSWRQLSDLAALVVDMSQTRREVLEHFRRDMDRSVIRFDGFIGNRRPMLIPDAIYKMIT